MRIPILQFTMMTLLLVPCTASLRAQNAAWEGQWISTKGLIKLTQNENDVSGTIGKDGTFTGQVDGNKLAFEMKLGRENGTGNASLDESGREFIADLNSNVRQSKFKAYKKNSEADESKPLDFSGLWLSSMGTLVLEQDGKKVTGTIGPEGWSWVKNGEVIGTRLEFDYVVRNFKGKAWLEQTEDGGTLFGLMDPEKAKPVVWTGIKPNDYDKDATPKAGEIVKGVAENGMLYNLRMPDDWKGRRPAGRYRSVARQQLDDRWNGARDCKKLARNR